MSTETIIAELKRERTEQERTSATALSRAAQLTTAIEALEGRRADNGDGLSVPEMIEQAARHVNAKTPGAVFENKTLVATASELHPQRHSRIKRGIYSAIATLKRKNILELAPGGVKLKT